MFSIFLFSGILGLWWIKHVTQRCLNSFLVYRIHRGCLALRWTPAVLHRLLISLPVKQFIYCLLLYQPTYLSVTLGWTNIYVEHGPLIDMATLHIYFGLPQGNPPICTATRPSKRLAFQGGAVTKQSLQTHPHLRGGRCLLGQDFEFFTSGRVAVTCLFIYIYSIYTWICKENQE